MSNRRRKEIKRHLIEKEIDEALSEADDEKIVRRLTFITNLYHGDTIKEAAERIGRSESIGDQWAGDGTKAVSKISLRTSRADAPEVR